jgi:putative ABC transport system permease protein
MSIETAGALSFKNLLTKKGRSITTAFAASIGIIGVALVLALSTGFSGYMTQMQTESLAGMPITINEEPLTIDTSWQKWKNQRGEIPLLSRPDESGRFTEDNVLYRHDSQTNSIEHRNVLTQEYFDYIANIKSELPDAVNSVSYSRALGINLLAKGEDSVIKYETTADSDIADEEVMFYGDGTYLQEIDDNAELNLSLYDLIGEGSRLPKAKNEVAIVVDEYNRIDKVFFEKLGMLTETDNYTLTDFIGKTKLKVIPNDAYYTKTENGLFIPAPASEYSELYENADGVELTITGILRIKENSASVINYLVPGFVYTTALTDYIVDNAQKSEITVAQKDSNFDVVSNTPFVGGTEKKERLLSLGADTTPTSIKIYPKDYAGKGTINDYLDAYNVGKSEENQIVYSDVAEMMESMVGSMVNATAYILIGFAAISLMVSTIMIAIITYVSVLERTKEIGILRSIGARKKDISRVFNAEAVIIGLVAGLLGVGISFLLTIPINLIISSLAGISGIANLTILNTILLVLGSMCLTLIAGFIPARMAANQDPVVALRK